MWKLTKEESNTRTYYNSATGSQSVQSMVYTDKEGNQWWQFADLTAIPYTRQFAATKVTSLFALGLSKDDLFGFINTGKTLVKSNDKEKYEKLYAAFLDFENKAQNATDAVKQMSSLVCVYFTINDEQIDSFIGDIQTKKMALLEADEQMHAFFLKLQIDSTERYQRHSELLSQIALSQ